MPWSKLLIVDKHLTYNIWFTFPINFDMALRIESRSEAAFLGLHGLRFLGCICQKCIRTKTCLMTQAKGAIYVKFIRGYERWEGLLILWYFSLEWRSLLFWVESVPRILSLLHSNLLMRNYIVFNWNQFISPQFLRLISSFFLILIHNKFDKNYFDL